MATSYEVHACRFNPGALACTGYAGDSITQSVAGFFCSHFEQGLGGCPVAFLGALDQTDGPRQSGPVSGRDEVHPFLDALRLLRPCFANPTQGPVAGFIFKVFGHPVGKLCGSLAPWRTVHFSSSFLRSSSWGF